jgi:hypothetical protein
MEGFDKLITRWNDAFYGEPFLALSELIAIIIGLIFVRNYRVGQFFLFYIIFDFITLIIDLYLMGFSNYTRIEKNTFMGLTNALIAYIELSVYYYFFLKTLNSTRIKMFMKISFYFFTLIMILFLTNKSQFSHTSQRYLSISVGVLEFFLIIPVCLTYYIELFENPLTKLFQRPSFWITTGIFFYAVISIPYYLIFDFLYSIQYLWFIQISSLLFYIPFGINFLFLTRAFLCKKQLTI